jgi:uncharacterized protein YbjT (DUF2867 family)
MRTSGLTWVLLRPGLFMQNTLAQAPLIKSEGKMVLPFAADLPLAFVDVRDTGAVGARILREPKGHGGKTYEFTGAATTFREFAQVFSEVLGKTVNYVAATLDQAEQAMKARGLPDWLIAHQLAIARLAAKGAFSNENTRPITDIVGRKPITTRQFVETYKAAFN